MVGRTSEAAERARKTTADWKLGMQGIAQVPFPDMVTPVALAAQLVGHGCHFQRERAFSAPHLWVERVYVHGQSSRHERRSSWAAYRCGVKAFQHHPCLRQRVEVWSDGRH